MIEKKLQNLVLPTDEKLQAHWALFYRGPRCVQRGEIPELHIAAGNVVDFATYLNGFSTSKWMRYTNVHNITLCVTMQGSFAITAVGYHLNPITPDRHEFFTQRYTMEKPGKITLAFPENQREQLLSFEIQPYTDCVLYGGSFYGVFEDGDVREINLALATTTCRKEEYITHNLAVIQKEIFSVLDEMREHFFVHVVDNGQTLDPNALNGYHVTVHPNKNTGGAGGFARGMMESLRQETPATHVLLMDDDVLILPESLRRTYQLLTVLKTEYQDGFISGAMLEYGKMNLQHEDMGKVMPDGGFCPMRPEMDQYELQNVLKTNLELPPVKNMYAAWWYCCIPADTIRKNGLPLPLFIRGDDVEYSLRCKPKLLSMTGICVWHMGFANKYNASMNLYQEMRNVLIDHASLGSNRNINMMLRVKNEFRRNLLEYSYDSAELILRAVEDYLKGPEFIAQDLGEKILKENGQKNEKMQPLTAFESPEYPDVCMENVYDNPPRARFEKWIYRFTYNGQRLWPEKRLKQDTAVIGFDWSYQPQVQSLHKKLLAVNIYDRTAHLRVQDRARFRELQKHYKATIKAYDTNHVAVEEKYREAKACLTSEEFWKGYLELQ